PEIAEVLRRDLGGHGPARRRKLAGCAMDLVGVQTALVDVRDALFVEIPCLRENRAQLRRVGTSLHHLRARVAVAAELLARGAGFGPAAAALRAHRERSVDVLDRALLAVERGPRLGGLEMRRTGE